MITDNRIRTNQCERYDIKEDKWEMLPNMTGIRLGATPCLFKK